MPRRTNKKEYSIENGEGIKALAIKSNCGLFWVKNISIGTNNNGSSANKQSRLFIFLDFSDIASIRHIYKDT